MRRKESLTYKRIGAESLVKRPESEGIGKAACSFPIKGLAPFPDSCILLRLESEPPNKTVSRELPGKEKRRDMQFESKALILCRPKQVIVAIVESQLKQYYSFYIMRTE